MAKVKTVGRDHLERTKRIYKYLVEHEWTMLDVGMTLEGFEKVHGIDKAHALDRFIDYAEERHWEADRIAATIGHDLNGRNQLCFLPRTSSY